MSLDLKSYLPTVESIARAAGDILREGYSAATANVQYKSAVDLVTQFDTASEKLIVARLRAAFPEHDILAEESGAAGSGAPYVWIVDPLDGTTNFAHGFPAFAVSIALAERAAAGLAPVLGVVYDPLRDELFTAVQGGGAALNGRGLHVSAAPVLDRALIATGFPYDVRSAPRPWNNFDYFVAMHLRAQGLRRAGAAALDLSYVAAGRLDGYWENSIKAWDIAAGIVLVQEAAGRVSDYDGAALDLTGRTVLASNGLLHEEMMGVLRGVRG